MDINDLKRLTSRKPSKTSAPSVRRPACHLESELQRACVQWFRLQYPKHALLLFAVPNGGGRSRIESAIMHGEGVTPGVSDLILLEGRGGWGSLCIEMKTDSRNSKQSAKQRAWQGAAEEYGNRYEVVRTFEQFRSVVNDYMGLPQTTGRVVVHYADVSYDDRAIRLLAMEPEQTGKSYR